MRRGMGHGLGQGYRNLHPRDPYIHSLSRKGIKTYAKYVPITSFKRELKREHIKPYNLPIQTAIIVPSTKDVYKKIPVKEYDARIKEVYTKLFNLFGGFTSVQGGSAVKNKKTGMMLKEPVSVVVAYANKKDFEKKKEEFIRFVEEKKEEWGQEDMGVIIENDLLFI